MSRESRKLDHLKYALALADGPGNAGFGDFDLVHNCLSGLSWQDIRLDAAVAGMALPHPLIINAVTGGAEDVAAVNGELAEVAKLTGAVMAVGSQYAALKNPALADTYKIVRKVNPEGKFIANLGAHVTPAQAAEAVDMIGACAIQLHLNPAQEMVMAEGDRDFSAYRENIAAIAAGSSVPVIAKEVGCGIAAEQAAALAAAGVRAIDVGGKGGTNFVAIEAARRGLQPGPDMLDWGIPTALSAVEVAAVLPPGVDMIVSGGIRTPLEAVKALAIGGKAVALAAPLLHRLRKTGVGETAAWLNDFLEQMKLYLLLIGAAGVDAAAQAPLVIRGAGREWLTARGVDTAAFARRKIKLT